MIVHYFNRVLSRRDFSECGGVVGHHQRLQAYRVGDLDRESQPENELSAVAEKCRLQAVTASISPEASPERHGASCAVDCEHRTIIDARQRGFGRTTLLKDLEGALECNAERCVATAYET